MFEYYAINKRTLKIIFKGKILEFYFYLFRNEDKPP